MTDDDAPTESQIEAAWWANPENEDSIVMRSYGDLAVYLNPHGDVVLRQEAHMFGSSDNFIAIPKEAGERVARRILELLAGGSARQQERPQERKSTPPLLTLAGQPR